MELLSKKKYNVDAFQDILEFAARSHKGQEHNLSEMGQTTEYLHHIVLVVNEVFGLMRNSDEDFDWDFMLACALLHDIVEDTNTTIEDLRKKFGDAIAEGVLALTKNNALKSREKMPDSLGRIKQQPREIWCVKLADRIANLVPPPFSWNDDKGKTGRYVDEAELILRELKDASAYLATRLASKIKNYRKTYC